MRSLLISLLLSAPVILPAQQDQLRVSLKEAQAYALEHNKTLRNAHGDVRIAEQQYRAARGQGLPQVNGSVDYMTNFNYEATFDFGGDDDPQPPDIDFTKLDAGDFEILNLLNQMSASSSSTIVMTDQANAQVQVSQLLFGGQYWVGLQTARIAQEMARQSVNITELDVRENVAGTYQLILVTEEIMAVLEKNITNLEDIKTHTNNMYAAGLAEQTDVDQIAISISQLENQKKSMERNISLSYNMLRLQMGMKPSQELSLTDSLGAVLDHTLESMGLSTSFNVTQNPNYQIVYKQEQLQAKMVDMQKWAYAPTLTGFYSYTEKIMTTGFDLSPNNAAGLNLSVPIFSSGVRKAQLDEAKIELEKAKRSKELLEEQLQLQNNQLRYELSNAYDNYLTQKQNVEVARRLLKSMQNKYRQGVVSSLDLTQANSNYLQAESNYLNGTMQLMQSSLKLKKLYNQL